MAFRIVINIPKIFYQNHKLFSGPPLSEVSTKETFLKRLRTYNLIKLIETIYYKRI